MPATRKAENTEILHDNIETVSWQAMKCHNFGLLVMWGKKFLTVTASWVRVFPLLTDKSIVTDTILLMSGDFGALNWCEGKRIIMKIWRDSEEFTLARIKFELLKNYPVRCPVGKLDGWPGDEKCYSDGRTSVYGLWSSSCGEYCSGE